MFRDDGGRSARFILIVAAGTACRGQAPAEDDSQAINDRRPFMEDLFAGSQVELTDGVQECKSG